MRKQHDHGVAVYDGREPIGFVVEMKCGRFAAYDIANDFVGEFSSLTAAIGAIPMLDPEDRAI